MVHIKLFQGSNINVLNQTIDDFMKAIQGHLMDTKLMVTPTQQIIKASSTQYMQISGEPIITVQITYDTDQLKSSIK